MDVLELDVCRSVIDVAHAHGFDVEVESDYPGVIRAKGCEGKIYLIEWIRLKRKDGSFMEIKFPEVNDGKAEDIFRISGSVKNTYAKQEYFINPSDISNLSLDIAHILMGRCLDECPSHVDSDKAYEDCEICGTRSSEFGEIVEDCLNPWEKSDAQFMKIKKE